MNSNNLITTLADFKAFFPFEKNTLNNANYQSAIITGNIEFVPGFDGYAIQPKSFDNVKNKPSTTHVELDKKYFNTDKFTIAFDLFIKDFPTDSIKNGALITNYTCGFQTALKIIINQNKELLATYWNVNTKRTSISAKSTLLENNWYKIAVEVDKSNHKLILFVNGIKIDEITDEAINGNLNENPRIFGWYGNCDAGNLTQADAKIDNLIIYDRLLSEDEIYTLTHKGIEIINTNNIKLIRNCNKKIEIMSTTHTCDIFQDKSNIATFPLDGNTDDICKKYNLVQVNGKFVQGKFGQGFEVGTSSNTSNYLKLCNSDIFNRDIFTISFWVYKYKNNTENTFFSYATDKSENALLFIESFKNKTLEIFINGNDYTLKENSILPTNEWIHFVLIQENNKTTLYINNKLIASKITEKLNNSLKNCLIFGQEQDEIDGKFDSTQSLIGIYDQIRIFNKALNENETKILYNEIDELELTRINTVTLCDIFKDNHCIATFPFDGNVNNLCGNYGGTWSGTEQYDTGKFGQAAKFDGDSYINHIPNPGKNEPFTVNLWVKDIQCAGSSYGSIIFNYDNDHWYISLNNDNKTIHFGISDGSEKNIKYTLEDISTWHMLTLMHNGIDTMKAYIDGKLIGTQIVKTRYGESFGTGIYLGANPSEVNNKNYYLKGLIDQLRIFNKTLTDKEIQILYNEKRIKIPKILQELSVNEKYNNLTEKVFNKDGFKYMVGNGEINLQVLSKKYDLEFIIGSFGSVDEDNGQTNSNDYIKLITNTGEIIFQAPSNTNPNYRILSNTTNYKAYIEKLAYYSKEVLENQDSQYSTTIYKITVYNLDTTNIKIQLHTDESYSNESFGYRVNSAKAFNKNTSILQKIKNLYEFDNIDQIFNQYGEVKIQTEFTYQKTGKFLASASIETLDSDYLILTILDFTAGKIKINVPGLFYNYLVDDCLEDILPVLSYYQKYILELRYKADSVVLKILDYYNKEIIHQIEFKIGLITYLGLDKLKDSKFKFGINSYSPSETALYYNAQEALTEDFLYVGDKILDDDYLGCISFDNSIEILSKESWLKNAFTLQLDSKTTFEKFNSNYRYSLVYNNNSRPNQSSNFNILSLNFNTNYLLKLSVDSIEALLPVTLIQYPNSAYHLPQWKIKIINGNSINEIFLNKNLKYSTFIKLIHNIRSNTISVYYLDLNNNLEDSILKANWKKLSTGNGNKANIQLRGAYIDVKFIIRGIYFYYKFSDKYLSKSTFNMNLPFIDRYVYNNDSDILNIQV